MKRIYIQQEGPFSRVLKAFVEQAGCAIVQSVHEADTLLTAEPGHALSQVLSETDCVEVVLVQIWRAQDYSLSAEMGLEALLFLKRNERFENVTDRLVVFDISPRDGGEKTNAVISHLSETD